MYWRETSNGLEELIMNDFAGKKYNIVDFYIEYAVSLKSPRLTYMESLTFLLDHIVPHLEADIIKKKEKKADKHCLIKNSDSMGATMSRFLERTLKSYKITPIEAFQLGFETYTPEEAYAYRSPDGGLKIYQPKLENHTGKWISIQQSKFYDGEWLLDVGKEYDVLFITTSRKDSCVIHECLHAAINPFNNEKEIIDIEDLKTKYTFKQIIYIKDNDSTGDEIGEVYLHLGCKIVSVPTGKDPYEFVEKVGYDVFLDWINSIL
jgi:hypothetical protein